MPLLVVDLVVALAAALWLTAAMRRCRGAGVAAERAASPRGAVAAARRAAPGRRRPAVAAPAFAGRAELRAVWADRAIRRLAGVAFLGFGVFVALTTWLQALLEPAGISDETAGWLLGAMVLAGVVGSALLPAPLARRGAERTFLRVAAVVAAACCAPRARAGAAVARGRPARRRPARQPAGDPRADRAALRSSAATALIWLAGNAGGIVVAVLVQAAQDRPGGAFSLLAATAALVLAVA